MIPSEKPTSVRYRYDMNACLPSRAVHAWFMNPIGPIRKQKVGKHAIVTDGYFSDPASAGFHVTPGVKPHDLEDLFRYEVFKMLKAEDKITDAVIENMLSWRHSGMCIADRPFGPMMKTPSRIWPIMSFAQLFSADG
jgi:hypothetical protein